MAKKVNPALYWANKAKEIINQDLIYIYGSMCILLHEQKGWTSDEIEDFVAAVQEFWNQQIDDEKSGYYESIPNKLKRITGIEIDQIMKGE